MGPLNILFFSSKGWSRNRYINLIKGLNQILSNKFYREECTDSVDNATFKFQAIFRDKYHFKVEMRKLEIGGFSGFTRPDSRITPRYGYRWKEETEGKKMIYGSSKTKTIFFPKTTATKIITHPPKRGDGNISTGSTVRTH